ncbi:MAG: glycoside hydrolase family 88 protein [Spirochaetales bacterium]|nr:glycoside hydrolase family 88 protein [Spirochaetales bacterium]
MVDKYIDEILEKGSAENPVWNQEILRQGKKPHWNYIDGCMMTALMRLYDSTEDRKYLDFCDSFIDHYIAEDGSILGFKEEDYNLDNIKEGTVLFRLYELTGKEKYRKAMDLLYTQLQNQPRTKEGNFWHKQIYPNQVWLDGLYMGQPFYLEYEKRFNSKKNYSDILAQFKNVYEIIRDRETGLYKHAYDSSREMYWCDSEKGLSPHYWLRALGWYVMALVDVLELLDEKEDSEFYVFISKAFVELVDSLLKYQQEDGMWYQVADRPEAEKNYPETSGSSIICYALLKAVSLGILPGSYAEAGRRGFSGICEKYLYKDDKGDMCLGGTCLVAGLGGARKRDGSYEYYMSEPVVENEAKGIAPFLLAYIYLKELEK